MYDYFLGGYHNFEIDRRAAEQVTSMYPDMPLLTRANRAFLRRVVTFLSEQGIDQFLDIGSGIPTAGSVHEVALQINPAAHIVYVDNEPIAVNHSLAILEDIPNTAVVEADARQADQILAHPDVQRVLDFSRPVGILLVALLHFVVDDEEAYRAVRTLRESLVSGSYVAISHGTNQNTPDEVKEKISRLYASSTNPAKVRSRAEIERFFDGLELVAPGLVYTSQWRPEGPEDIFFDQPERSALFAGVARKP
jgi:hypothetical protein